MNARKIPSQKIPSQMASPGEMPEQRNPDVDSASPARASAADERRSRIAERAYFHAQRRGFADPGQLDDWLSAEREIDQESRASGSNEQASLQSDAISDSALAQISSGEAPTQNTDSAAGSKPRAARKTKSNADGVNRDG